MKFSWEGGAAFFDITGDNKCTWGMCGLGPAHTYKNVPWSHFDDAISSLLGWDHPVARSVTEYVKALKSKGS